MLNITANIILGISALAAGTFSFAYTVYLISKYPVQSMVGWAILLGLAVVYKLVSWLLEQKRLKALENWKRPEKDELRMPWDKDWDQKNALGEHVPTTEQK